MVVEVELLRSETVHQLRRTCAGYTFASQVLIWTVAAHVDTEDLVAKNAVPWVVLDTPQKV